MTTYKITIKDNSIPEHMQKAIPNFHNIYTAEITNLDDSQDQLDLAITELIEEYAVDLNTDPESLEILSIIKQ